MYCVYCGTRMPENALFCPACGAKTAVINVEEKERPFRMHAVVCASCGGGDLKRIGKGEYRCEHCGTRFFVEEPDDFASREEDKANLLAIFAEADGHAARGDHQEELKALSKGLELAPEDGTLLLKLGRACNRLGLIQEALEYYREAQRIIPNDPIVYVNQAVLYMTRDMDASARPLLEKAIALIEEDPMSAAAADVALTYSNYALCIGKLGDRAGARKYLNIAKNKGCDERTIDYVKKKLKIRF